MDDSITLKEGVSGLIGMFGFLCLFCGADTMAAQAFIWALGFALIGLAYLVWCIWTRKEAKRK